MSTVTQIARNTKQPYGGYLPVKQFDITKLEDDFVLNEDENIEPSLLGTAVDYLTRFMLSNDLYSAFNISLKGAKLINMHNKACKLLKKIKGLDDLSIINACKLCGFDVCYRLSVAGYIPIEQIEPDNNTIENIRIMVKRTILLFEKYGPITCFEPTFEGGYTYKVNKGDGDYLTKDTIWDIKVLKNKIKSQHTLQILMYYILGCHSIYNDYRQLKYLGFYNPRRNEIYLCSVSTILSNTILDIEKNVIGYNENTLNKYYRLIELENKFELTVSEICELTEINKSKIYKDIKSGYLIATKVSNKYLIKKEDLNNYLDTNKQKNKDYALNDLMKVILIFTIAIIAIFVIIYFIAIIVRIFI